MSYLAESKKALTALELARQLVPLFASRAAAHDRSGDFATDNITALYQAGLLGLVAARSHGGYEAGLAETQAVISEIARGDPSTALVLAMHYACHGAIRRGDWPEHLATRVLKANHRGPALLNNAHAEPGIGSPAHGARPETIARRDGDVWRVTGRKSFVTGLPGLKWAIVLALSDEVPARLLQLLVPLDAPGVRFIKSWDSTGMHATASDDLVLESVAIPLDDIVVAQPADQPLRRDEAGTSYFFTVLAAVYHGVALAARDRVAAFITHHQPASLGAPLGTVPRLQEGLGDIEIRLATNQRLLYSLAQDFDHGRPLGHEGLVVRHVVIENAAAITDLAIELAGNRGLRRDFDLERYHRDAITARSHAPQNHMIRTILGKAAIARQSL